MQKITTYHLPQDKDNRIVRTADAVAAAAEVHQALETRRPFLARVGRAGELDTLDSYIETSKADQQMLRAICDRAERALKFTES